MLMGQGVLPFFDREDFVIYVASNKHLLSSKMNSGEVSFPEILDKYINVGIFGDSPFRQMCTCRFQILTVLGFLATVVTAKVCKIMSRTRERFTVMMTWKLYR